MFAHLVIAFLHSCIHSFTQNTLTRLQLRTHRLSTCLLSKGTRWSLRGHVRKLPGVLTSKISRPGSRALPDIAAANTPSKHLWSRARPLGHYPVLVLEDWDHYPVSVPCHSQALFLKGHPRGWSMVLSFRFFAPGEEVNTQTLLCPAQCSGLSLM